MRHHRLTTAAGTLLVATAVATAPAAAQSHQDLRSPDARDAARQAVRPHQDLRSPDARDAATRVTPVVVRVAGPDSGLEWDSAAIGALAGAGLLISIAGGGVLIARRRPRAARPA
jgi:hypothetical protein